MLSRALILAAVTAMLGCFAAVPAAAQNLEAGKPPSAIFSSTCSLCHKSSRGLLKTVSPGSLPGFLREHYTTSKDMASVMAAYVLSNGAANAPLAGGNLTKQGKDSRTAPKPSTTPDSGPEQAGRDGTKGRKPVREASRPDVDGLSDVPGGEQQPDADAAKPDAAKPAARQKGAKGKPAKGEPPKVEARHDEPPKADSARPDPVPAVTPAPPEGEAAKPQGPKSIAELPTGPLSIDLGQPAPATPTTEPAGPPRVPVSQ